MSKENKLIIAAAGSGKTTFLVKQALASQGNILITTFTRANEDEIKSKLKSFNKGSIPKNITVQTWFSFLLQHGVRPFQGTFNDNLFKERISNLILVQEKSGYKTLESGKRVYFGEAQFNNYYFTKTFKIYSDKLAKFVIKSNEKCGGKIIDRLERIYGSIFIDEVQDLAGYDLEMLMLLFKSKINVLLVGDPRQVTYLTHPTAKFSQYKEGKIKEFINTECKKLKCVIDEHSLAVSHRNNLEICNFSSRLYPSLSASKPCNCEKCRAFETDHAGIYLVKENQIEQYRQLYEPTLLRAKNSIFPDWNFGKSKGLGFSRVLIYPTSPIIDYLKTGELSKMQKGVSKPALDIPKFYVALTRARHSVGIVYNFKDDETFIDGVKQYQANPFKNSI